MRAIIPTIWLRETEEYIFSQRQPTRDRDAFKKEVAFKLLADVIHLEEDAKTRYTFLFSQMSSLITGL